MKKEKELEFLSMSLQDFFSKEISPKYKFSKDFNKKLIEHILDNKCNDTISFAFQMTLRDWLDFFTLKKNLKDIINENNNINYQNIDSEIIEKSLVGVEKLLYRIKKNADNRRVNTVDKRVHNSRKAKLVTDFYLADIFF